MINCSNPLPEYNRQKRLIDQKVLDVLNSGSYIMGENVNRFEQEFAEYVGTNYAISCASGTDALVLALMAHNIGEGDEVIVPSHTATATIAAIRIAGAIPVYCDIEEDHYTLSYLETIKKVNAKTKAIVLVHLYGNSCDIEKFKSYTKERGILLVEDCAQSTGTTYKDAKLGSIGDIGCFSFFPTKNLGCIGDGGAVTTNNLEIRDKIIRLKQYGWDQNRISQEKGINSRLDEIQAAILRAKLPSINNIVNERRDKANYYKQCLSDLPITLPAERESTVHSYHLYVIKMRSMNKRDNTIHQLKELGINCGIHYRVPVHKMNGYKSNEFLPITENTCKSIISLPLYPGLQRSEQDKVIDSMLSLRSLFE